MSDPVRAAVSRLTASQLVDLARAACPPAPSSTDARRAVRHAVIASSARRRSRRARVCAALSAASVVTLGAAVWLTRELPFSDASRRAVVHEPAVDAAAAPLRVRLPSGDALWAEPGARFQLMRADREERRVELGEGTLGFAVDPLADSERFVVVTPHLEARVRGTVFVVSVQGAHSTVQVFEGAVEVERAGRITLLGADQVDDGRGHSSPELSGDHPVVSVARREAAARRAARAQTSSGSSAPSPPSADTPPLPRPRSARDRTSPTPSRAREAVAAPEQPDLAEARSFLHDGQFGRALAAASDALRRPGSVDIAAWLLLEGDALRGLDRAAEAFERYREAARQAEADQRALAGYKAADIALRVLQRPHDALEALRSAGVDAGGSPLRERGLLLRIDALRSLGRPFDLHVRRYLSDYPDSAGASYLRSVMSDPSAR